jgi:hypothetical protein
MDTGAVLQDMEGISVLIVMTLSCSKFYKWKKWKRKTEEEEER